MAALTAGRRHLGLLLRIVLSVGVLVLCGLLFRQIELDKVWVSLRQAKWHLIVLAVLLNVTFNLWARANRWAVLLEPLPVPPAPLRDVAAILIASYASSNLLPGRAGEALRTFEMHRRYHYPVASMIASQLIEKVVEAQSMGMLALATLALTHPPPSLWPPIVGLSGLGFGTTVLVIGVALGYRRFGGRRSATPELAPDAGFFARLSAHARSFFLRLVEAIHLMHAPRIWLRSVMFSLTSDLIDLGMMGMCLYSVGIHVGPGGWLLTFLTVNLAITVPSTPGQIGVHEASAVLALSLLGVEKNVALAGALLYHAAHVVPTTLIGLYCLRTQFLRRKTDPAEPDKAGAPPTSSGA